MFIEYQLGLEVEDLLQIGFVFNELRGLDFEFLGNREYYRSWRRSGVGRYQCYKKYVYVFQ